jgi:hypothetical protein
MFGGGAIIAKKKEVTGFEIEHEFEKLGRRRMPLNAGQLKIEDHVLSLIVVAIQDISARD